MNQTINAFGYPGSLVREYEHWVVLARLEQITLGSLVLAAKSEARAYGSLPPAAFVEQGEIVAAIERVLRGFCAYEKINYLMLMMVDPNVHFHVIPRYPGTREWNGIEFPDSGWPKRPQFDSGVKLTGDQLAGLASEVAAMFP